MAEPLLDSASDGYTLSIEQLCDMFHPDNIKNPHPTDGKVSISLYEYWKTYHGPKGLAAALKTNLKTGIVGSPSDL
jgi:hypothetical protein